MPEERNAVARAGARRMLPYLILAATVVLCAAVAALAVARRGVPGVFSGGYGDLGQLIYALVFSGVGFLVARARPRNSIGWILLFDGVAWALGPLVDGYAHDVLIDGAADVLGIAPLLGWFGRWGWVPIVTPAVVFVPMYFPDGRLISRRWWPLPACALAGATATAVAIALSPGDDERLPGIANPYAVDAPWVGVLFAVGFGLMMFAVGCTAVSLVLRMRRGTAVERQQLKIFFFGALFWPLTIILTFVFGDAVSVLGVFTLLALPVAIGIAILRYRLYDIDLLINRTLVYGALTALLGLAYVLGIVLFQTLLRPITSGSEIAVTASTLAVIALFGPLRSRIQKGVDRRFYRRRYDAAATVDAFALRLRDSVDLDALTGELLSVVGDTVQPAHASVWLRERAR
ncbi:MAG: hypothetical protein ABR525_05170 [Candidatus Limnocylindria bacterium]